MAAPTDNSIEKRSQNLSLPTGDGVVVDIGTGDGSFVYQCARENPNKFFIGIDANLRPLKKISERIKTTPAKGGLTNAFFLLATVEDLPEELEAVADEVHVHFPWGSLLAAFALGKTEGLKSVRRICSEGALLEVVMGLDVERDRVELARLGIGEFTPAYVRDNLVSPYRAAGFEITETEALGSWSSLHTSWARRLQANQQRRLVYLIARASPTSSY